MSVIVCISRFVLSFVQIVKINFHSIQMYKPTTEGEYYKFNFGLISYKLYLLT